jgi:pimeloyl-ACP methyl ester carboxylesterase
MATFVLVHGSWHGGWCWQRLAPILRAAGHGVLTPTLTGMGERAHAAPADIRLGTHVEDVLRTMAYEDARDVVLVGHSYAGMVITGVAARDASRLRGIVYLDAYLPDPGQSEQDLWPADFAASVQADLAAGRKHRTMPAPSFFGLDGADAAWAAARLTPQPLAVYLEPASQQPLPPIPARFIHCTRGPIAHVFGAFAARARARGWPVDELPTGHDCMLTMPQELAKLLLRAA